MIRFLKRLVLLVVLLCVAAAGAAVWVSLRLQAPYRGFSDAEIFVDLPAGSGVQGIARRLTEAGVVVDPYTFRLAARLSGSERRLQAGEYRFADPATPGEIVARLARGDVAKQMLTIPEGLTIREMSAIFASTGLGTAEAFVAAASDGSLVADLDPDARTLEAICFRTRTRSRGARRPTSPCARCSRRSRTRSTRGCAPMRRPRASRRARP
jgi:UPF0755 protein